MLHYVSFVRRLFERATMTNCFGEIDKQMVFDEIFKIFFVTDFYFSVRSNFLNSMLIIIAKIV